MKTVAAVQTEIGGKLLLEEIDLPDPGPDQVTVKLYSSGVCHSQLHQMHNHSLGRPLLLGHEGTGVVTRTGSNVTHVKDGDQCIVTWVPRTPVRGPMTRELTGATFKGQAAHGSVYTWARDVQTSKELVVPIPKDHPRDLSCIVGCAVLTGAGAVLHTARVRPGESVAVFGVGGVGLSAIRAAAILGGLSHHCRRPQRREARLRALVRRDAHGQCLGQCRSGGGHPRPHQGRRRLRVRCDRHAAHHRADPARHASRRHRRQQFRRHGRARRHPAGEGDDRSGPVRLRPAPLPRQPRRQLSGQGLSHVSALAPGGKIPAGPA